MSSPSPDSEEHNIEDIIGGYYMFFQSLAELRDTIETAGDIGLHSRSTLHSLLDHLEGHFRENQEWIITRDVQEIRMGVVGAPDSCKSTFISAFHEGVVELGEDEPNGRYKIKLTVGRKPCLLLIREESNFITRQLSQWVDIIMFVFSYSSPPSLDCLSNINKRFKEYRVDLPEPQVLLVGVVEDVPSKAVSESEVRKVASEIDNCRVYNTTLSQPSAVHNVFIDACRQYILSYLPLTPSHSSNQPAISQQSYHLTHNSSSTGGKFFGNEQPQNLPSPMTAKRNLKKKMFRHDRPGGFGNTTKAVGTGRYIPIKEGLIYKKSAGMRSDWKKKYLVLTETSLTYYPNHNDYMNQAHGKGKTVNLQHITVKVPGQHMPIAKTTSLPRSSALLPPVETLQHQSDRNNSISPMSSVDVNKQMSSDQPDTSSLIKVTPCSPPRQPRSPTASDDGSVDDLTTRSDKYPFSHRNMGHLRNNSMDEITLQLLKTSGAAFPAQSPLNADDQQRDRSFTLNRMQAKKGKLLKGTMLSPISYSEEELSEPSRSGSHENLKQEAKKNKKDNKNRNSLILGERSGSDSIPNKDEGKKDKKMAPKHRRNASQGFVKTMDVVDTPTEHQETTEFHIHSLEGKVWLFDAANMEEMNDWVKAVEGQIKKILEESLLPKRNSSNEEAKAKIIAMKGNDLCADCGSPNPEWASLNHGCLVCIDCSGVHRKLGSHISKIKGLHLDEWKPELVSVMTSIGNEESWKIFEAKSSRNKPTSSSSVEQRERYIKAKYCDKEFLCELPPSDLPLPLRLLDAVKSDDPVICLQLLAHCTIDDVNYEHPLHHGGSVLHVACNLGRVIIVQLLVWNLADVDLLDYQKHSPLFYARIAGYEDCAQILIQNNCNEDIGPHQSPLSSEFGSTEKL